MVPTMKLLTAIYLLVWPILARGESPIAAPSSFAYVLQADALAGSKQQSVERLSACERDWIILDMVFDNQTPWTRHDLDAIRHRQPGRKILCYLSIGEAEVYRPYWRAEWTQKGRPTPAAPTWLCAENPNWAGNFPVKFWHSEWQKIVLQLVDEAMARGFDGLYLDIVDGFENFERDGARYLDDRLNPETRQSFRRDMVDWVKTIAARARSRNPAALIVPQNGSQLLAHDDFRGVISAIGIEDLFTEDDNIQSRDHTENVLTNLRVLKAAEKPILLIEYPRSKQRQSHTMRLASKQGMVWLITDRDLATLGVSGR